MERCRNISRLDDVMIIPNIVPEKRGIFKVVAYRN
jgi:hypothetical protein